MRTAHVIITGAVQGVGYRIWVEEAAIGHGLNGWVRNRRDGSVEAVFAGDSAAVDAMLAACREGPRLAAVRDVVVNDWAGPVATIFKVLPTA